MLRITNVVKSGVPAEYNDAFPPGTQFIMTARGGYEGYKFELILSEDKKKYGLYVHNENRVWGPNTWRHVDDENNLSLSAITTAYRNMMITHVPTNTSLNRKIIGILNEFGENK